MESARISRIAAIGSWLKLGYLVGCDAGTAFCIILPVGLRTPFRVMAEAHEAARRSRGTQSETVIDQLGYLFFQAITYIGVVPANLLGRFVVGPLLGILTMLPFCVPAAFGAIRHDATQVDHFNWFSGQAYRYGPISVWGGIGTSLFLTALMGLGYLPNVAVNLPGVESTWTTLGLAWVVPFACSFMAMSLMGFKQWAFFTKNALTHHGAQKFPLTGTIRTLELKEDQKKILLDLFQDEHQRKIGDRMLYEQVTAASYDPVLLLAQLEFAKSQQHLTDEIFDKNILNRILKVKR